MKHTKLYVTISCLLLITAVNLTAADAVPSKEQVKENNEKAAAQLDRVANALSPNTGKLSVVKRLSALFRGTSAPIIPTKKFVPAEPYLSMHDIISKDPLVPPRTLIIYRMRFMLANNKSKTQDTIEGIVGESGTVEISEQLNTVVINVLKERAEAVKAALLALDQPIPQVLVETQVVEVIVQQGEERDVQAQYTQVTRNDDGSFTKDTYGIKLDSPGQQTGNSTSTQSGFNFAPISKVDADGSSKTLQLAMKWLQTSTDSKILASPNLIAELGSDAKMTTGEEIPYAEAAVTNTAVSQNIKFKKTGINLTIKPVIINPDTVRLEIKPEIIMAVRYQTFTASGASSVVPIVSIRNITTTLTAADGEVIMLGGLYSSEVTEEKRKTPFLSDLPVIGEMFTAKSATVYDKQLLFFMKVHILKNPYAVMTDLEQNAAAIQDIGHAVRDSGTLFKIKPGFQPENHESFFTIDSFWSPKSFFPEWLGNEPGNEKRPEPRQMQQSNEPKKDESASTPAKGN